MSRHFSKTNEHWAEIEPLLAKGLSPATIFKLVRKRFGWLSISALYRVIKSKGSIKDADGVGLRAARTKHLIETEFPVGFKTAHLTISGAPEHRPVGKSGKHWFFPVQCSCGKFFDVTCGHLRDGTTTSCGHARIDRWTALNKTHGCYSHRFLKRLRAVHAGMLRRCKSDDRYLRRGIIVHPVWKEAKAFIIWCLKNGYLPGKSLDRKNNHKGYGPANCRFVSDVDNANNRSSSRIETYNGKTQTLAEHCRELGLHYHTVYCRLESYGWDINRALGLPTIVADKSFLIYLGWRKHDAVFTVGKSSSWFSRKRRLMREGFSIVGVHRLEAADDMGLLEYLLHDWFDSNNVERGVASKSKHSLFSPETVRKADLVKSGFKFHKLCGELLDQKPSIIAELQAKLLELEAPIIKPEKAPTKPPRRPRPAQPTIHPSSPVNGVCHQRVIRDDTKAEDVARLTPIIGDLSALKASQFTLAAEPYAQCHRDFIKRYEWLGNPGISIKWCFAARFNSELGGVVLLSEPYHPSELEALIARGACAGWTPKNLGSRMVMFACRWMAENTPKRQFIAYADEEAGEVGQIYQACNFKFLGWKEASYGLRDNGKRVSLQTFKRTSRMVPWLAKQGIELPVACFTEKGFLRWSQIPLDLKKRMRQHIEAQKQLVKKVAIRRGKYVMVQGATPAETRRLNSSFNVPTFPYPKRAAATPTATPSSPACAPTRPCPQPLLTS